MFLIIMNVIANKKSEVKMTTIPKVTSPTSAPIPPSASIPPSATFNLNRYVRQFPGRDPEALRMISTFQGILSTCKGPRGWATDAMRQTDVIGTNTERHHMIAMMTDEVRRPLALASLDLIRKGTPIRPDAHPALPIGTTALVNLIYAKSVVSSREPIARGAGGELVSRVADREDGCTVILGDAIKGSQSHWKKTGFALHEDILTHDSDTEFAVSLRRCSREQEAMVMASLIRR
jgi:hypothetical protein